MSKQSSLDFILENLHLINSTKWKDIIDQAKAMHKEEIMEANSIGYTDGIMYANGEEWVYQNSEHYYEETFGGNNKSN